MGRSKVTTYRSLDAWLEQNQAPYTIEVVKRPADAKGYVKLPRRWDVEPTPAAGTIPEEQQSPMIAGLSSRA